MLKRNAFQFALFVCVLLGSVFMVTPSLFAKGPQFPPNPDKAQLSKGKTVSPSTIKAARDSGFVSRDMLCDIRGKTQAPSSCFSPYYKTKKAGDCGDEGFTGDEFKNNCYVCEATDAFNSQIAQCMDGFSGGLSKLTSSSLFEEGDVAQVHCKSDCANDCHKDKSSNPFLDPEYLPCVNACAADAAKPTGKLCPMGFTPIVSGKESKEGLKYSKMFYWCVLRGSTVCNSCDVKHSKVLPPDGPTEFEPTVLCASE